MKQFDKKSFLFYIIISVLIASTLCYGDLFIYKSLTPFFCYLFCISISFIFGTSAITRNNKGHIFLFSRPILIAIILGLYIFIQSLFLSKHLSSYSYYLIINCGFFVCLCMLLGYVKANLQIIYKVIVITASVEAAICILQYWNLFRSFNTYFPVTGTWENPNVIAMFMAMAVPCAFSLLYDPKKHIRRAAPIILFLLFSILLILKCRTAVIGSVLGVLVILNGRYGLISKARERKNRSATILITCLLFALIIPAANYAYEIKKASADGRKLVWKISSEMIVKKPLLGYGYGLFERNYNLYQAQYFESGKGTSSEIQNAGFVRMGYNELLQNAVEGGLVGCFLLAFFFLSLLLTPVKHIDAKHIGDQGNERKSYITAYAGVCVFILMSLINFTVQAIPAACLFIIYAAILAYHSPPVSLKLWRINLTSDHNIYANKKLNSVYALCLFIVGIISMYTTSMLIKDNLDNKEAALLSKQGNYRAALNILSPLSPRLEAYESFWVNYGNTLFDKHDYKNAAVMFDKGMQLTSNPAVYGKIASCYEKVGDYNKACRSLEIAANIEPNRISPQFDLMNLCLKMKDTTKALVRAQNIISLIPKIPTIRAQQYKIQTYKLIERLGFTYDQNSSKILPLNFSNYLPNKTI